MCKKQVVRNVHGYLQACLVTALLAAPAIAGAQPKSEDEDELSEGSEDEGSESAAQPTPGEDEPDLPPASVQTAPPPPPVPAAPPPSPFTFVLKGQISGSMLVQDVPMLSGNGGASIFSPVTLLTDKWFLGGDIRQSRLTFTIKGPPVLGGATPTGVFEIDLGGGNQITTVPGAIAPVTVTNMGMPVGTGVAPTVTSSAFGDESLLPRVRVAYVELMWGAGTDILRVGQFHNLLLPQIAASASHTGTPLGYGAGQLGWRSPGITYLHRFPLSADVNLDVGIQLNRNSWIDNFAPCAPTQMPPPATPTCLPAGVSLGEASMLPQVEARVLLSGGKAPSPWPLYAPNVWQIYAVGHWDQKDLSGVGSVAAAPYRDGMTTGVGEFGFKLHVGPVLLAANGYAGQNSGNVYGNILQMQLPSLPDVSGFGGWGQIGFDFGSGLSLWAFGGMDKVDRAQAESARFSRAQNVQLAGMFAYVEGPIILALEYLYVSTVGLAYATAPVPPATVPAVTETTTTGNQIAFTVAYNF